MENYNAYDADIEDFIEMIPIIRKRIAKIDWENPQQFRLNRLYHVIKTETHSVSRYTDINLNKEFNKWWKA